MNKESELGGLDLSVLGFRDKEASAITRALIRGANGPVTESTLELQFKAVKEHVDEIKTEVAALGLVLEGRMDIHVSQRGTITYRKTTQGSNRQP